MKIYAIVIMGIQNSVHNSLQSSQSKKKQQWKSFTLSENPACSFAYWPAGGRVLLLCQCKKVTHCPVMLREVVVSFPKQLIASRFQRLSVSSTEWFLHPFSPSGYTCWDFHSLKTRMFMILFTVSRSCSLKTTWKQTLLSEETSKSNKNDKRT